MAFGGISASGLFDLKKSVQYIFEATGTCSLPTRSRAVTSLLNYQTNRSIEIAGTEFGVGADVPTRLQLSASLLLEPGRYSWITEVRPNPATNITASAIQSEVSNSQKRVETLGVREAFSAMSGPAGKNMNAEGRVTYNLGDGERLSFFVVVTNLMTQQQITSPVIKVEGADQGTSSSGVLPYVLTAGHIYLARIKVSYEGQSPVTCLVLQT